MRAGVRQFAAAFAAASGSLLAGCASQPVPVAAVPDAAAEAAMLGGSAPVVGAIPLDQLGTRVDALQATLAQRLQAERGSGVIGVSRRADGAPRLLLDTAQSFEVGSAQLRAGMLLRLADCATAVTGAGAFVVHVIGLNEPGTRADGETLGERRAVAVLSYLRQRGLPASRLRAEGRAAADAAAAQRLELVFEPIVQGREVRAWMPPR